MFPMAEPTIIPIQMIFLLIPGSHANTVATESWLRFAERSICAGKTQHSGEGSPLLGKGGVAATSIKMPRSFL